jgi:putative transposase
LQQLTRRVPESALEGEITDHVGDEKRDPAGKSNGTRAKSVLTDIGPVEVKTQPTSTLRWSPRYEVRWCWCLPFD